MGLVPWWWEVYINNKEREGGGEREKEEKKQFNTKETQRRQKTVFIRNYDPSFLQSQPSFIRLLLPEFDKSRKETDQVNNRRSQNNIAQPFFF